MGKVIKSTFLLFILVGILCAGITVGCSRLQEHTVSGQHEEPYEIVIENQTLGEEMPDLAAVEEAINAITLPALNCKVKILNISIADHRSVIRLMKAQNRKIDLINTGRTDPLEDMVRDQLLIPLDELLPKYGKTLLSENRELLDACTISGKLYSIPAAPQAASSLGYVYNADLTAEYGISLHDYPTISELESAAETMKKHGKYLVYPSESADTSRLISVLSPAVTSLGNNYYHGVLLDDDPYTIRNLYETDEYLDYCQLIRRWYENGWIPKDYLTSGISGAMEFRQGKFLMTWSGTSPVELALQSNEYNFRIGMITVKQSGISTSSVRENGWGISTTSENPQKAMEFLNFVYENAEIANLFMNGIEGREYQKVSDHIITFCNGETASSLKYRRIFTMFGDFRKIYEWSPMTENDYESLQQYYSSVTVSNYFGYAFNPSPVASEVAAVQKVLSDYQPALECGILSDVPAAVRLLNEKLQQAGINRIIEENQRQLDEWLTVHNHVS